MMPSPSFPPFPGNKSPRVAGSSVAASGAQVQGEGQSNAWDLDLEPHFERSGPRRAAWAVDTLTEGPFPSSTSPSLHLALELPLSSPPSVSGSVPLRPCSPKTETGSEWTQHSQRDLWMEFSGGCGVHYPIMTTRCHPGVEYTFPTCLRVPRRPAKPASHLGGIARSGSLQGQELPWSRALVSPSDFVYHHLASLAAFRWGLSNCFHPPS